MRRILAAVVLTFTSLPTAVEAELGDCGQPVSNTPSPTATDALFVLQVAIGTATCEPAICDVDATCTVTATDSLRLLQRAIDPSVEIDCNGNCGATTTTAPPTTVPTTTMPPPVGTWSEVFVIFAANGCALAGCHGSEIFSADLGGLDDFDAGYESLVAADGVFCVGTSFSALIVPGDPDASFLVNKIAGTPDCGVQMPQGSPDVLPAVAPADVGLIRSWILAGAPKN